MGWICPRCGYVAFSGDTYARLLATARSKHLSQDAVEDWYDGVDPKDRVPLGKGSDTAPIGGPKAHIRPSWFKAMDRRARDDPYMWRVERDRETGKSYCVFVPNPDYDGPRIKDLESWRTRHHIPARKPWG